MKTKYLFYSLALASAFTACSQEELVEAPVVKDNVADRPVAGVVEFSTEGVESRYNYEKNDYEIGDVFGLYLMDNFNNDGKANWVKAGTSDVYPYVVNNQAVYDDAEHWNANGTPWKYQNHWFGMYSFTNHIQSNYPFRYVSEGGQNVWKNDAKLVEGNYFAMYPQNEKALNRRELWHAIKPSLDLKVVKSNNAKGNKYQNVENQFWLGYKQIYRDATSSAESVMKMNVEMKAAMVALKFYINNSSNADVTLDKIVIKDKTGAALPTLAYIEPASYKNRNVQDADKLTHHTEAGWVIADNSKAAPQNCDGNIYANYGLYDETKTWTRNAVYNLVNWTVPGTRNIPYGLDAEDRVEAYEYSFSFPANTKVKGLNGGGDVVYAYVTIPALKAAQYKNLSVSIYGWEELTDKDPAYGVLVPHDNSEANKKNYSFMLNDILASENIAEEGSYYRDVNVIFDNVSWDWKDAGHGITPSSTKNMEDLILNSLSKTTGDVTINVSPDANGVEMTSAFLAQLKSISAKAPRNITVVFDGIRGGKVEFNENNTLFVKENTTETGKYVEFQYINGIKLYNHAEQTITNGNVIQSGAKVINEGDGVLNVVYTNPLGAGTIDGSVENNGTMIVSSSTVNIIDNNGQLTLTSGAVVTTLQNNQDAIVDVKAGTGTATVTNMYNDGGTHPCYTCTGRPTLNVSTGTLDAKNLINGTVKAGAVMNIASGATLKIGTATNEVHIENNTQKVEFVNRGTIKLRDGGNHLNNKGTLDNYGVISAPITNRGAVNAWAGEINDLKNIDENCTLNALSEEIVVKMNAFSNGNIVYTGVIAQYIQKNGASDKTYFRTVENMEVMDLIEKMTVTGSKILWIGHDLDLTYDEENNDDVNDIVAFRDGHIQAVKVEGNIKFVGERSRYYGVFRNVVLSVDDLKTLNVPGMITVEVKNLQFNDDGYGNTRGRVLVGDGAKLITEDAEFSGYEITSGTSLGVNGNTNNSNSNTGNGTSQDNM